MKTVFIICGMCLIAGCATSDTLPSTPANGAYQDTNTVRRAVVAGLTAVDPKSYGGWAGDCPGCDTDAQMMAMLCREQGIETTELHNSQTTKNGMIAAARKAWKGMKAGDLLVVYISGHGGQMRDTSGDESDGQDETLCLWDGQLSDDVLGKLWQEIPAGVRVFFVTDTCNSGTNFKYKPRKIRKSLPRAYTGTLIHYGGCADGKSSVGGPSGGVFTTAMIDAWEQGISYVNWFQGIKKRMPKSQIPIYAEYGTVTEAFRNAAALK